MSKIEEPLEKGWLKTVLRDVKNSPKPMTKREQKRLLLAEETCRALRTTISKQAYLRTEADWGMVMDYLIAWMNIAPKRFDPPTYKLRKRIMG